jgi:hypothetical protein
METFKDASKCKYVGTTPPRRKKLRDKIMQRGWIYSVFLVVSYSCEQDILFCGADINFMRLEIVSPEEYLDLRRTKQVNN